MRSGAIPFQFAIGPALQSLLRKADGRPSALQLSLPFVTVHTHPTAEERKVAAEIVLRAGDRRVLSSYECCDGCIDKALASLQELRAQLVDEQIRLAAETGVLSGLIELMLVGIRQFLTFEQNLPEQPAPKGPNDEFYRSAEARQAYFDALEQLRGHLSRCLGQIALIAGTCSLSDGLISGYRGAWPLDAYLAVDPGL